MCGLIAMVSKTPQGFSDKDLDLFNMGLYATAVRGLDSTGCFSVKASGNVSLVKDNTPSADFLRTPDYQSFETEAYVQGRIMVGHCRAATRGEKTAENAHPFIAEHIALVHNGTLWHHNYLANTTTDSEAIAVAFSKGDPQEIIPELSGAYALLWYDAKNKSFHATRNKERPLWIIQTPTLDFIGSEPGMLEWILNRATTIKNEAKYFDVDTLYTWKLDDLPESYTDTKLKRKIYTKTYPQTASGQTAGDGRIAVYKDLYYTDRIHIDVTKVVTLYATTYVEGTCKLYPELKCICYIDPSLLCKEELLQSKSFFATIGGKQNHRIDTPPTLIVHNPTPVIVESGLELEDINGKISTLTPINSFCSRCNVQITSKDSKKIWFRIKKGICKSVYCPTCVKSLNYLQETT